MRPAAVPFVALGGACVVGGGLVSAATAPTASYHSSWAVAYLVLVAGVAQAVLGLAQAALAGGGVDARTVRAELVSWNIGNAAVLAGTLLDVPPVLYAGCALVVATLVLVLRAVRHAPPGPWLLTARAVIALLLISMPVGIVLQTIGHGSH